MYLLTSIVAHLIVVELNDIRSAALLRQLLKPGRLHPIIGIDKEYILALCPLQTHVTGIGNASIGYVNDYKTTIPFRQRLA